MRLEICGGDEPWSLQIRNSPSLIQASFVNRCASSAGWTSWWSAGRRWYRPPVAWGRSVMKQTTYWRGCDANWVRVYRRL